MSISLSTSISRFRHEDMCAQGHNCLPISSVCNARCLYCSNHMNPFPIYRCGFRPLREVVEWIQQNKQHMRSSDVITLSDVQPGRISEGEATIHPNFFKICELLRNNFLNTIHITTNGSKLTEKFISTMAEYKPFRVMLSYHSTDMDNWTKIFGLSAQEFLVATEAFGLLNQYGIETSGAIVAMPALVGYPDVEKTMMFMNDYCTRIRLWRPLYGKSVDKEIYKLMKVDPEEFKQFAHKMYKQCDNCHILWDTDPDAPLSIEVTHIMKSSVECGHKKVMWLTAEINYTRLHDLIETRSKAYPNEHYVQAVTNHAYGGNASCNGLLMVSDLKSAIENSEYIPDLIIASDKMLDKAGNDLMGVSFTEISEIPIWWQR